MMKVLIFCLCFILPGINSIAQIDTPFIAKIKSLDTANILKIDTTAVPDDLLTKKIKILRNEKSGLTTETVIKLKIMEEQAKDTKHSKEFYRQLMDEVTTGKTGRLIENSLINLYRRSFTENEIDELIRFYNTSAGKKMDREYILLMVESVKDAEQLLKIAMDKLQPGKN